MPSLEGPRRAEEGGAAGRRGFESVLGVSPGLNAAPARVGAAAGGGLSRGRLRLLRPHVPAEELLPGQRWEKLLRAPLCQGLEGLSRRDLAVVLRLPPLLSPPPPPCGVISAGGDACRRWGG